MTSHWMLCEKRTDIRARELADRHYNRQSIGHPQFTRPGNNIVLIVPSPDFQKAEALWVSQRPDPKAGLDRRLDGFIYWNNSHFRNESSIASSELIREAVAITMYFWGSLIPEDGFHTFVDPRYVKPTRRHGENFYGYCYFKADWTLHPQRTLNGLWRYILPPDELGKVKSIEPRTEVKPRLEALF